MTDKENIYYQDQFCSAEEWGVKVWHLCNTSRFDPAALEEIKTLVELGANINTVFVDNMTPLMRTAFWGNAGYAGYLATQSDVQVKNSDGRTAAHIAAINENLDVLQELLLAGADRSQQDTEGHTVDFYAANYMTQEMYQNYLKFGLSLEDRRLERQCAKDCGAGLPLRKPTSVVRRVQFKLGLH